MTIITSNENDATQLDASFKIVLDPLGSLEKVDDLFVNSASSANHSARKLFLEKGYAQQRITFQTPCTKLHINDIIIISAPEYKIPTDLAKNRFIVKAINSQYVGSEALDIIQAVRYD